MAGSSGVKPPKKSLSKSKRARVRKAKAKASPEANGQPAQLPLNFGKRLAHTDKIVRDRGFQFFKHWLQKNGSLERLDYMKLWKGLYFGMWMADKRPVQQELAVNIAVLLGDIPREKRQLWIETFWVTMQDAWEKLDVHRINKYMLFTRIVIAEAFKNLRVGGWDLQEAKALGETLTSRVPRQGTNAPSVGLLLQFNRIFWEELRPQLSSEPRAPEKALLQLIEPFLALAETSYLDSLVRSIHDNIIRRAPHDLLRPLTARVLDGAGKPETNKQNRQALYDAADELEKLARQKRTDATPLTAEAAGNKSPEKTTKASPKAQKSTKTSAAKSKSKKKSGKRKELTGDCEAVMSPLLLPQAAVPLATKAKRSDLPTLSPLPVAATEDKAQKKRSSPSSAKAASPRAAPKRKSVSFDMKATQVTKFLRSSSVATTKRKAAAGSHARSALRKAGT